MTIDLHWSILKPIAEINYTEEDQGAYIWGFMFDGEFLPYYVGNAYHIQARLTEHVSAIIGGAYCIIHADNLKEFSNYKRIKEATPSSGLLYYPDFPEGYKKFLENRKALQPHIDNMVERMFFSFASFNDEGITKEHLEQIENKCISTIGKDKLWNRKCGNCDNVVIGKVTGDEQIAKLFELKTV